MPEHRVTGTASIDKGGGTTLEILGELARESSPDEIIVLFGLEEDGTPLTIFDCQYTTSTSRFSGLESATLESQLLVGGAHLTTLNDIQFESVVIGYEHVDRWLGKSGIGVRPDYTKNRAEILFQCPPPMLFGIMSDIALEIEFDWHLDGAFAPAPTRASVSQVAKLSLLSARPRSFKDFRELIFRLSCFFCFAMDRGVAASRISAQICNDSDSPISDDRANKVSLFYPDYSPATTAPFYSHWKAL